MKVFDTHKSSDDFFVVKYKTSERSLTSVEGGKDRGRDPRKLKGALAILDATVRMGQSLLNLPLVKETMPLLPTNLFYSSY